ncbi:MAG TPA: hypothetical protein EYQ86_06490 [Bacteroidetes bacterium]|nr:hypothetical protein [Bacteroidota bacterium]
MDQIEKQMDQIEKQMDEMKTGESVPSVLVEKYNELNELRNEYIKKYNELSNHYKELRELYVVKIDSINQIVAEINEQNETEKAES